MCCERWWVASVGCTKGRDQATIYHDRLLRPKSEFLFTAIFLYQRPPFTQVASKQLPFNLTYAGWIWWELGPAIDDAELCGLACRPSATPIHRNITTAAFTLQTHYTSHNLDIISRLQLGNYTPQLHKHKPQSWCRRLACSARVCISMSA